LLDGRVFNISEQMRDFCTEKETFRNVGGGYAKLD
jgi:hypothetical protein